MGKPLEIPWAWLKLVMCCFGMAVTLSACANNQISKTTLGYQGGDRYNLSNQEKSQNCASIRAEMRTLADETVALDFKNQEEYAKTAIMWGLFGAAGAAVYRATGDTGDARHMAKLRRAKLKAYDAMLPARGCKTWDHAAYMKKEKSRIREEWRVRAEKRQSRRAGEI